MAPDVRAACQVPSEFGDYLGIASGIAVVHQILRGLAVDGLADPVALVIVNDGDGGGLPVDCGLAADEAILRVIEVAGGGAGLVGDGIAVGIAGGSAGQRDFVPAVERKALVAES